VLNSDTELQSYSSLQVLLKSSPALLSLPAELITLLVKQAPLLLHALFIPMVVGSGFSIGEGLMWGVMLALARTISAQLPHLSLLVQGGSILLLPLLVTFF
jgi:hypothetical protein